jgi:hypothetical protein
VPQQKYVLGFFKDASMMKKYTIHAEEDQIILSALLEKEISDKYRRRTRLFMKRRVCVISIADGVA